MSRTTRLFLLMDALRGHRRPVAAERLAQDLDVSVRTIYRDMQTLIGLGAPIAGEAGVGYVLTPGFFLPPLMFGADELEALVLGARWVQGQGDEALARAAKSALDKIATASPKDLRETMANTGLWSPPNWPPPTLEAKARIKTLRELIREERKIVIRYTDEKGQASERTIWPIGLAFYERVRVVISWCELREGFRSFRADRIETLTPGERYPQSRAALLKAWRREQNYPED